MEPQTPLALPPEHKNNRKFIIIIVSLFVLFTVSASLMYFVKDQLWYYPEVIQNQKSNNDSEWITYKNEEYGFDFKYPQGFTKNEEINGLMSFVSFDNFNHQYIHGGFIPENGLEIMVAIGSARTSIDDIINLEFRNTDKIDTDIEVDGVKGRFIKSKGDKYVPVSIYKVYVIKDNHLFQIGASVPEFTDKTNQEFNKILSTFKFTNNYETFDPDGTLSDISINKVFGDWIKLTGVSYSVVESSVFSSSNIKIDNIFNNTSCNSELKLITSPDGKRSMCFGNAGEPDSELFLSDNTNNTLSRMASCGTPCIYQSGFWLDDDKFVFLWTMNDYEYENNMKPYYSLNVDMYNLKESKIYSWTTKHLYKN